MEIYVVKPNDNVEQIANNFGISVERLVFDNQIPQPYELAVGQALLINNDSNPVEDRREIYVNGFAYPFISNWVLQGTLPYLSTLSVFSYGFTSTGFLIPPALSDERMISETKQFGKKALLTLTPFGPDGNFNNILIHDLLQSEAAQNRLREELAFTLAQKGFSGVDIDFEFIQAEDRDLFSEFVRATREYMNALGYSVSVDLAPKTSSGQVGLLYEGKDYQSIGAAADYVLVMTYEWGYTYGPPLAVAPLPNVRRVLEYALTEIPAQKIMMGIPNYGYDWPLPYERGVTAARTIGNVEAVRLAIENGVEILYDEEAQSPYFFYEKEGVRHEVWFEDVRSLSAKFSLVKEFMLRGMGYWQIMQFFRANWLLLENEFIIRTD